MWYPDFFFLYLPGTETVCQHLLLHGAGPMVSHCSKFPQPPCCWTLPEAVLLMHAEGQWLVFLPGLPHALSPSGLLKWWHSGQPWKLHVEDGGTAINLGAQMTKRSCCSVIHTKKELLLCWSHYILGLLVTLTLVPTNTLSGHFGDPKPTFCDTDDFSEANHCACIQLRNQRCGESTQERQTGGSTCTALPLVSAPMDAAVAIVLGTVGCTE